MYNPLSPYAPFDLGMLSPDYFAAYGASLGANPYYGQLAMMRSPTMGPQPPAPPPSRQPVPATPAPVPASCPPCGPQGFPQPFPPPGYGCGPQQFNPATIQELFRLWQWQSGEAAARRGERTESIGKQPQIPLGGASTTIASGTSGTITISPTVGICPTQIEFPEATATNFLITSVTAARQELLGNGVGVPAESFRPDATNLPRRLEFPQLLPGQDLVITLQNIDGAAHVARVTLWGIPITRAVACAA